MPAGNAIGHSAKLRCMGTTLTPAFSMLPRNALAIALSLIHI